MFTGWKKILKFQTDYLGWRGNWEDFYFSDTDWSFEIAHSGFSRSEYLIYWVQTNRPSKWKSFQFSAAPAVPPHSTHPHLIPTENLKLSILVKDHQDSSSFLKLPKMTNIWTILCVRLQRSSYLISVRFHEFNNYLWKTFKVRIEI